MLLYTRIAAPKAPKKRSRAGCINCKEKKKKCDEKRPICNRCTEKNLGCGYEAVPPRKRKRTSFAGSTVSQSESVALGDRQWLVGPGHDEFKENITERINEGDNTDSSYQLQAFEPALADQVGQDENSSQVEEVPRAIPNSPTSTELVKTRSQYPDLAMIAPSPTASLLLEFCAPAYEEFALQRNRRMLVDHFCNNLSHLLVFKEDNGNPFRQLVLPLSHTSSPILNAIFALSSAHLEYRGVENDESSESFHNRALQGLASLVEENDLSKREEILGAIMLLVYYEVLVQRGNSNIVNGHLKGALTIMKTGNFVSTPATRFLKHAFRFYDVITALSLGTSPNSIAESVSNSSQLSVYSPRDGNASPLSTVDTLLGLSTDLWPIIYQLARLPALKQSLETAIMAGENSKAIVLKTELENSSQAIELALTNWQPYLPPSDQWIHSQLEDIGEDSKNHRHPRMQAILNNAEAYRHSAFLYLYRSIHNQPRHHPVVQNHAHLSLLACSSVVAQSQQCVDGPMSALLWPLFVAACEAITEEDRGRAVATFAGVERRQGMINIIQAWEIVQIMWARYDAGEEEVQWREISKEKGWNIVFG